VLENVSKEEYDIKGFIKLLRDEEVISLEKVGEDDALDDALTPKIVKALMKSASALKFNDSGELIYSIKGEEKTVDPGCKKLTDLVKEVTSVMPEITFDIDRNGIKTQQMEAQALYKCIVINTILGGYYDDDIEGILDDYNYEEMCDSHGISSFKKLLEQVQQDASRPLRIVLSCCNGKLVSDATKNEALYSDYVEKEVSSRLDELSKAIKVSSSKFNIQIEEEKNKIKRLTLISNRDKAVETLVNAESDISVLYRINAFTTEVIPLLEKNKTKKRASVWIDKLTKAGTLTNKSAAQTYKSKLIRRALKLMLRDIKISKFEEFNKGNKENLIPKV
jgi:hypothetical protein